jgi:hypothetical protein
LASLSVVGQSLITVRLFSASGHMLWEKSHKANEGASYDAIFLPGSKFALLLDGVVYFHQTKKLGTALPGTLLHERYGS